MRITFFLLIGTVILAAGNTVVQSDWSGGPGEPGPVLQWGDEFSSSGTVDYQSQQGQISILWGKLTDFSRSIAGSQLYAIGAYPGDVDLDGDLDILVASSVDDQVLWWENLDGAGSDWTSHQIDGDLGGAWGAICADIDQDGDNDVFGSAMGDGVVVWWENTDGSGTSWNTHSIDDSLAGAKAICVLDLNGDGLPDIAAAAKTDDVVVWYENPGTGSDWAKTVTVSDYAGANSVYAADLDGDGDLDILSAAKGDKALRWFENTDGMGGAWAEHSITEDLDNARTAEAADLDGDGDIDVVGTGGMSKASGRVCWWENTNGSGTSWIEHSINDDFQGPYTVLQHDMDGDGDSDILSGSLTFNAIYWWENTGSSGTWEEHVLCNYFAPRTVSVADLDGDGAPEVFAGSLYSANIAIWEVMGFGSGGLISSILDTQGDSDWTSLAWDSQLPSGTSVGVSLRSSWDENDMGEWSDTVYTSPLDPSTLVEDSDRFIQYVVVLNTDDPEVSPVMEGISLSYDPLGIAEGSMTPAMERVSGNPVRGTLSFAITVPCGGSGCFSLLDISGRTVYNKFILSGSGQPELISIDCLLPGIYFGRFVHSQGILSTKLTVIR